MLTEKKNGSNFSVMRTSRNPMRKWIPSAKNSNNLKIYWTELKIVLQLLHLTYTIWLTLQCHADFSDILPTALKIRRWLKTSSDPSSFSSNSSFLSQMWLEFQKVLGSEVLQKPCTETLLQLFSIRTVVINDYFRLGFIASSFYLYIELCQKLTNSNRFLSKTYGD